MANAFVVGGGGGGVGSDEVTATAGDVLSGKTYVGSDTNDEIGTGTLALTGNAAVGDVIKGQTFYSNNAKSKQTGTLALTGNAAVGDVIKGQTFYSNNAKSKLTGTLDLTGNAAVGDVLATKTFYSTNPKSKLTGTMVNRGAGGGTLGINGTINIPAGYYNGTGKVTQSITTYGGGTFTPTTGIQTVSTSGKYCTGNVVINPIPSNYYNNSSQPSFFKNGSYGPLAPMGAVKTSYQYVYAPWKMLDHITTKNPEENALKVYNGPSTSKTELIIFKALVPRIYRYLKIVGYGTDNSYRLSIGARVYIYSGTAAYDAYGIDNENQSPAHYFINNKTFDKGVLNFNVDFDLYYGSLAGSSGVPPEISSTYGYLCVVIYPTSLVDAQYIYITEVTMHN